MTTYYVATTGSDANSGALASPWLTLLKAGNTVATGSTVELRGGTYSEQLIKNHDTLTIQNYSGENVVVSRSSAGTVLGLENCRNVTLRKNPAGGSFTVTSTVTGETRSSGVLAYMVNGGSPGFVPSGITVDGLVVTQIAGWGIQFKNASAVIAQNVDVSHCGTGIRLYQCTGASFVQDFATHHMDRMIVNTPTPTTDDNGGTGVALDLTDGATVQRGQIYECHATSNDYGVDGGAVEFYGNSNCVVQWITAWNNEGFIETGTPSPTTYPMPNNIIRRCIVYGTLSTDTPSPGDTPGILVRAGTNLLIANNTFDVTTGQDIIRIQEGTTTGRDAPITGLTVENNIIQSNHASTKCVRFNNAPMTTTGIVFNYNLLRNTTGGAAIVADRAGNTYAGTAVAGWRTASGYSANDIWNTDPLFTNTAVRDYSLQGTSPALNVGVVIAGTTDGYWGAAPDFGALERTVLPPPGGTPATAPVITYPAADGYNTNGIVTISGTCLANSSIELFDGATSKGTTPAPSTTWSFTLSGVTAGAHAYTAKATDSASAVSAASNTRTITVDLTAPTVVSVSPANLATGVATNASIVVTFSEAMNTATITTTVFDVRANGIPVSGTIAFSVGNTVATFSHSTVFPTGTTVTFLPTDQWATITDVAGNHLV